MTKVLFAISEWGYWGEELVGPLEACDQAGYEVEFVTPTGARPTPLAVSIRPGYADPPQGRSVTSPEMAAKTRAPGRRHRMDKPHDLGGWVPARPYPARRPFCATPRSTTGEVERVVTHDLPAYDALVIVGGSGAMVDLANNQRLHELILGFVRLDRPIAAVCYGVAALAFARDPLRKLSIIRGKRVTGHPIDYDYHDGTGFEGPHALDGSNQRLRRRILQLRAAVLPAGVHPARRRGPGRRVHRQRRARRVGDRGPPVHHRPLHRVLGRLRARAGRRPRPRTATVRLVSGAAVRAPDRRPDGERLLRARDLVLLVPVPRGGRRTALPHPALGPGVDHLHRPRVPGAVRLRGIVRGHRRRHAALVLGDHRAVGDGQRPAAIQRGPDRDCHPPPISYAAPSPSPGSSKGSSATGCGCSPACRSSSAAVA